jgi:hypothetical protein
MDDETLAFADALVKKKDVRGELIVLESKLASLIPSDADYPVLFERADAIRKKALAAWQKELHTKTFRLHRGLPRVVVKLSSKKLADYPWLRAIEVVGRWNTDDGPALDVLMKQPKFARVRMVQFDKTTLTFDELDALCASDRVRHLEEIGGFLGVTVGGPTGNVPGWVNDMKTANALLFAKLLGANAFERLNELELEASMGVADWAALATVDGLPALRKLSLSLLGQAATERLLRSPLFRRLEVLELGPNPMGGEPLSDGHGFDAALPALRHLAVEGQVAKGLMRALTKNEKLPRLEYLDLGRAYLEDAWLTPLATGGALPSLKALRVRASTRTVCAKLEKRFGERLRVESASD